MARVPLDALVLDIHQLGLGPAAEFLAGTLEPPPSKAVAGALRSLRAIGALAEGEECLTPLGAILIAPLDPNFKPFSEFFANPNPNPWPYVQS